MGTPVEPSLTDALASNAALQKELRDLQAQLATAKAPSRAAVAALKTKSGLKKLAASVAAALSTPDAVKAEKSLAVVVLIRLAIFVPSIAAEIDLLTKALGG
jgi:hypothetical protein